MQTVLFCGIFWKYDRESAGKADGEALICLKTVFAGNVPVSIVPQLQKISDFRRKPFFAPGE